MQTTPQVKIDKMTEAGWWGQETLASIFSAAVKETPEGLALVDPLNREQLVEGAPGRLTFSELDAISDSLASHLFEHGLRKNDIILAQLPNTIEIVVLFLAAAKLGLIVSPVAVQYGAFEIEHIANTLSPKAYIGFSRFLGNDNTIAAADILQNDCQRFLFAGGLENKDNILNVAVSDAYTEYKNAQDHSANDILTICWTSGTTGRPKGVPRSHNHWLASTLATKDSANLNIGDSILCPFPFINMGAIGGFLYLWLQCRAKLVLHHPFEPMVYLQQLQDEQCVYTIAPPAALTKLLMQKDQIKAAFDLSKLRTISSGSAPLTVEMIEGFEQEFNVEIVNVYGSNEGAAMIGCAKDIPDLQERAYFFPRFGCKEFDWSNQVSEQIETRLVSLDTGEILNEAGMVGELEIAGTTVFDGYYQSPEDNELAFSLDGYFKTGDLFEIAGEKNQFYRFNGRCKDLIIRGGVNISPEELDEVISSHPDILEAGVYGYKDKVMGERVCAVIVPNEGASIDLETLSLYLDSLGVAKFKWPEKIKITTALPRNPMNKIVRRAFADI